MTRDREPLDFETRHSREGLLRRYARGRVRHFPNRQILTAAGSLSLGVLIAPWVGIATAAIALAGEAVDCLTLRRAGRWLDAGMPLGRLEALTTLTAALQAMTIAACVAIAWILAAHGQAVVLALAYLTGAAINAGIVMPFHRKAAMARLSIYALSVAGLFVFEVVEAGEIQRDTVYDGLGALMLAYMVRTFMQFVARSHARSVTDSRDLISGQRDLVEANRNLRNRQKELQRLSLVAEHTQSGIAIGNAAARPVWMNGIFSEMSGHTLPEAAGHTILELLKADGTDRRVLLDTRRAIREGRAHRTELASVGPGGAPAWYDMQVVPVKDTDGAVDVVIFVLDDITAAKQHEAMLARAKKAAEDSERAKTDFLATMSHEIRTPMNGILGLSELLRDMDLPDEASGYAQTIHTSSAALLGIINDVLDLSRLETGAMTLSDAPFDPARTITEAVDLVRPQAQQKNLSLRMMLPDTLPGHVSGDAGRFRQILLNLLGNAVKFTDEGSVDLMTTHAEADGAHELTVSISDTGIGISDADRDTVFERFLQVDSARTRQHGGTGLGLTISRLLARRLGGDVWLTPKAGPGACFTLKVSFGAAKERDPAGAPEMPLADMIRPGLRVLLAEDNAVNRMVIQKYLEPLGIDVVLAENGRSAVDLAAETEPELILMDMSMPELDGLSAARAIRAAGGRTPPIIALTANAFAQDREDCLAAGMDDFLSKPVSRADLIATIVRFQGGSGLPAAPQVAPNGV